MIILIQSVDPDHVMVYEKFAEFLRLEPCGSKFLEQFALQYEAVH